jgi:hypothetical protein
MLLFAWAMSIRNEIGNDSMESNNGKMREQNCKGKQVHHKN